MAGILAYLGRMYPTIDRPDLRRLYTPFGHPEGV
jgi:hypothetical protein